MYQLKMNTLMWMFLLFSSQCISANQNFAVNVNTDGTYNVVVQGNVWLKSAPTFFRADGKLYTNADGSLKLVKNYQSGGRDFIGQWESNTFRYQAGSSQVEACFVTYTPDPSIFTYNNPPLPFVLFKQRHINGANNTASTIQATISGFPGFLLDESSVPLGYASFAGGWFGAKFRQVGQWGPSTFNITAGLLGGPLALFDNVKTANTLIISSASEFMSSSLSTSSYNNIYWGTMGGVNMVPSEFQSSYIMFCGNQGINKAFVSWGKILQKWYGRTDKFVKSDFTNNYLGYWTDNGAYYYEIPEPGKSRQDTIIDVTNYIRTLGVPIRYVQYDDWWFYRVNKTEGSGMIKWDAPSNVFPNGVHWLYNKTNVPVHGYSSFWSNQTIYAKQNGGPYEFVIDRLTALPIEERFWTDILSHGRQWGLIAFEQDFLSEQVEGFGLLQSDVDLGKLFMKQMGNGAAKNGIPVQYCMALPRHSMQALEIPIVTQARVSHDYHPGGDQWRIGLTSLFAWALGIAPFKDNFWTTTNQPGNEYQTSEPYTALNSVVATLSTGPVGVSDMVGAMNKSLVMRSANADGLILKPSRPATAIDNRIRRMAWSDFEGPDGEVWSTYSDFGGKNKYGIILAADLNGSYTMTPCMAGYQGQNPGTIAAPPVFPYSMVYSANNPNKIQPLTDPQPLTMSGCTKTEFCLFYVSPVLKINGKQILIQGELDKWVPMSPQRVTDISTGDDIVISLTGAAYETVYFWFNVDGKSSPLTCTLGPGGLATLSFNQGLCRGE